MSSPELNLLQFTIGNEIYAIDVAISQTTIEMQSLSVVPNTPDSILGLTDVKGEVAVVVSLANVFDIEPQHPQSQQEIVLLDSSVDNQSIGLCVDSVLGLNRYSSDDVISGADLDEFSTPGFDTGLLRMLLRDDTTESDSSRFSTLDDSESANLVSVLDVGELVSSITTNASS